MNKAAGKKESCTSATIRFEIVQYEKENKKRATLKAALSFVLPLEQVEQIAASNPYQRQTNKPVT